jgi:hypothetical protein
LKRRKEGRKEGRTKGRLKRTKERRCMMYRFTLKGRKEGTNERREIERKECGKEGTKEGRIE